MNPADRAIKAPLYAACRAATEQRIDTIRAELAALAEAKTNETKSSVGDKYETGRAMLQLEEDKYRRQLAEALRTWELLDRIDPAHQSPTARAGSLVRTDRGNYYLAIGIGKLTLDDTEVYCVSLGAPLARVLLGKRAGDAVTFNGTVYRIEGVG